MLAGVGGARKMEAGVRRGKRLGFGGSLRRFLERREGGLGCWEVVWDAGRPEVRGRPARREGETRGPGRGGGGGGG